MTKTLTEQWKNGELECGYYYIEVNPKCGLDTVVAYYVNFEGCFFTRLGAWRNDVIKEVLAPVPSYDEWKQAKENLEKNGTWYTERAYKELVSKTEQLEKRLKIATKALKKYADKDKWHYCSEDIECFYTTKDGWYDADKALKEMEGVK